MLVRSAKKIKASATHTHKLVNGERTDACIRECYDDCVYAYVCSSVCACVIRSYLGVGRVGKCVPNPIHHVCLGG